MKFRFSAAARGVIREREAGGRQDVRNSGFLLGTQHAPEADHIAAVSGIAARRTEVEDIGKHGLTRGLGHTLTLFVFAGAAIVLGQALPEHLERPIEGAVNGE